MIPLDRDVHRRALMDPDGYMHRLELGFLKGEGYYKVTTLTPDEAAHLKLMRARACYPQRLINSSLFSADRLPVGSHLYKGKCVSKLPVSAARESGLVCGKTHAHERELISFHLDPMRDTLRLHANALRV